MTDTHKPPAAGHSADDKKHDAKDHGHGDKHEHKEHPIVPPTVELSDRLSHSAKVAGIMAEIRALVGENITGAARLDPIAGALDAAEAKRHINKIVENLYESRDPNIDHVRDAIHKRFEALLPDEFLRPSAAHSHGHNAAHAAGDEEHGHGGEIDPIHRTLVIGRALLDSVYEQIKDVDLVKMATSIAANIKVPTIKDHYYDGAKLTPEGLKLIEKLRKGGTNPVKVILAFSAAVDPGHFHPAGISSTTPSASVDAQKDINAELGLPEKNIPGAYKFLERLAVAVEAYKNTPRSELAFEPPTPPTTTSLRSTDTGQESFQKREERYQNAKNLVKAIGDAARRLAIYLHKNPVDSLKGFRRILKSFEPLPPELPNADHVKATLSAGLGTDLLSAEKYKELAEKKDSGMVGSRACDQILGTYIRRVTSVSEETAKDALAALTGRVMSVAEHLREDQERMADIHSSLENEKEVNEFNIRHKNGVTWRNLGKGWQKLNPFNLQFRIKPLDVFVANLDDNHCVGLQEPKHLLSDRNSLKSLEDRYYTYWYLTHLLPHSDEKRLPLTPKIATELTNLRKAITQRRLRVVHLWMRENNVDTLDKKQAEELGLRGTSTDHIPFNDVQLEIMKTLTPAKLEANIEHVVHHKVEHAWHPIEKQKEKKENNSWTKTWNEGPWYSPTAWLGKATRNPVTATLTGATVGATAFALSAAPGTFTNITSTANSVWSWITSNYSNPEFIRLGIKGIWNTIISNPVYAGIIGAAAIATPFAWREIRKNSVLAIGSGIGAATVLIPLSILPVPLVGVGGFYAGSIFGPKILRGLGHIKNWFTNTAAPSAKKHLWDETSTLSGKKGSSSGGGDHGHGGGDGGHH